MNGYDISVHRSGAYATFDKKEVVVSYLKSLGAVKILASLNIGRENLEYISGELGKAGIRVQWAD